VGEEEGFKASLIPTPLPSFLAILHDDQHWWWTMPGPGFQAAVWLGWCLHPR
jgi:hypothetical protein